MAHRKAWEETKKGKKNEKHVTLLDIARFMSKHEKVMKEEMEIFREGRRPDSNNLIILSTMMSSYGYTGQIKLNNDQIKTKMKEEIGHDSKAELELTKLDFQPFMKYFVEEKRGFIDSQHFLQNLEPLKPANPLNISISSVDDLIKAIEKSRDENKGRNRTHLNELHQKLQDQRKKDSQKGEKINGSEYLKIIDEYYNKLSGSGPHSRAVKWGLAKTDPSKIAVFDATIGMFPQLNNEFDLTKKTGMYIDKGGFKERISAFLKDYDPQYKPLNKSRKMFTMWRKKPAATQREAFKTPYPQHSQRNKKT